MRRKGMGKIGRIKSWKKSNLLPLGHKERKDIIKVLRNDDIRKTINTYFFLKTSKDEEERRYRIAREDFRKRIANTP